MRLERLHLLNADPSALRPFYGDVLGLPASDRADGLVVQAGASELVFERAPAGLGATYHLAFNIPPSRLAEARIWLEGRTSLAAAADGRVTFRFESWNADAVYFGDPAGNILELIARHDLAFDAPGPFGPSHLACISEIGMVFDDVREAVGAIERQTAAAPYRGVSDTFAPVGDEHGLFIVVHRGRPWFNSADLRAEPYPVRAAIEVGGLRFQVTADESGFRASPQSHEGASPSLR